MFMFSYPFEMLKIGLWMSGVLPWVMVRCTDFLSLSPYTMQRIDVLNVNITLKHGSRNPSEMST